MARSRLSRAAAGLAGALATLMSVELVSGSRIEAYEVVLVGAVVVGLVGVTIRLWQRNSFESRLAASLLALVALTGQVLVSVVGDPSRADGAHWHPVGLAVSVVAVALLGVLVSDARARSESSGARHPYAL
ncbi:hypothetical protein ABIE44_002790 [Marmoricola sp. OAE513]|uniref:hypothetical protein n=1 Tax=Marmoricola sp. OAE513 TaxID=2817894 RepID=UPI001AE99539